MSGGGPSRQHYFPFSESTGTNSTNPSAPVAPPAPAANPWAATTATATSTDFDLETITGSQIGKFNYPSLSRKALPAIAAV